MELSGRCQCPLIDILELGHDLDQGLMLAPCLEVFVQIVVSNLLIVLLLQHMLQELLLLIRDEVYNNHIWSSLRVLL
jgi:hypothetical protein